MTAQPLGGVRFGRTVLGSTVGDVLDLGAEAIVLAVTRRGALATGVAAGLKARGAGEIERLAMAAAPLEPGTALVTAAPGLEARGVLAAVHAVVHRAPGEPADREDVRRAVAAALAAVEKARWRSVAMPLLGLDAGGVGHPPDEAAIAAVVAEVVGCLRRGAARPDWVVLVARSHDHAAIAERAVERARRGLWAIR